MSFDISTLLVLDAAPQAVPPRDGGMEQTLIMLVLAMVFFYFLMWRPEKKRRKEMEAKRNALKKGDMILVAGGIVCEVDRIKQDTLIVKLVDGAKMEIMKGAIQDVMPPSKEEESKSS